MTKDPYRVIVEDRIRELIRYRRWYRDNRWADWSAERRAHMDELRALVRLAREARKVEADYLTLAKGYEDWTSGEWDHPATATVESEYAR